MDVRIFFRVRTTNNTLDHELIAQLPKKFNIVAKPKAKPQEHQDEKRMEACQTSRVPVRCYMQGSVLYQEDRT